MFYPEIHKFDTITHKSSITSTEEEFANSCIDLIYDSIQIIGGCCGVTHNHLRNLIERFN